MSHLSNVILGFLTHFVIISNAVPALFPHGSTLIYKYYADIKAGTIEPIPFASQFALDGHLHVQRDTNDPSLTNAYHMVLTDIRYSLYNGQAVHHEPLKDFYPIPEAAKVIEEPFLAVFNEHGKIKGVKMGTSESSWSKNIKQALVSMLQLDLFSMNLQMFIKPQSFFTTEDTIHGTCTVAYDVHAKDQTQPKDSDIFIVTKIYEPRNCTKFVKRSFDHVDADACFIDREDPMTTTSRRVFEIENNKRGILITKLISHGVINYFPWQAKSEAHYLLTNQTLLLKDVAPAKDIQQFSANFQNFPLTHDISFKKPEGNTYAYDITEGLMQNRYIVEPNDLINKVKTLLEEAADYLEENHLKMEEPDSMGNQTINKLLHVMTSMNIEFLEQAFDAIKDGNTPREVTIRNIFLDMIPHIGTTASCLFARNIIGKQQISDMRSILILSKLPLNVRIPSKDLLLKMEKLIKFDDSISLEVRKASILCFASIIYRTFKDNGSEVNDPLLIKHLKHFFDCVENESSYEMKMVCMMAIRNTEVGDIHKLLAPIVRNDLTISENPEHIRFLAMFASWKAVVRDIQFTHDLYWPILANTNLPLETRILAYSILVSQLPYMGRIMNLHWFMVYEKNEQLYNYHYTTIKSLANSVDPCLRPVREMARKILRFTRIRPVSGILSGNYILDYADTVYGYGEMLKLSLKVNEQTGVADVGYVEYVTSTLRKPVSCFGFYWRIEGLDDIIKSMPWSSSISMNSLSNEKVINVLKKAAQDMPPTKHVHVELCLLLNDRIVYLKHYNKDTIKQIAKDMDFFVHLKSGLDLNSQHVMYDFLYEKQVPTDLGLPAELITHIPSVISLRMNSVISSEKSMNVEFDVRIWRHGMYSMAIYNPIVDVWHSVQRVSASDMVLPFTANISLNIDTQSLKIILPRLPLTKYSVAGLLNHASNYVNILKDEANVVKQICPTCRHYEVVTKGTVYKKCDHETFESKDTGLQFLFATFDCESNVSSVTREHDWITSFMSEDKNNWNNVAIGNIMALRQQFFYYLISPHVGSCASLIKIEPSSINPTSHIDITLRTNIRKRDLTGIFMNLLYGMMINIRGTIDVYSASTNSSVLSWDLNTKIDLSEGHKTNQLKIQITRSTPGEKSFKICIDALKSYPTIKKDPLKLGSIQEETDGKLIFSMGHSVDENCLSVDTVISMTLKGELSSEQRKQFIHDTVHGLCIKDIKNPYYLNDQNLIPRTSVCFRETIMHTTLRKYTLNVAYSKVPLNTTAMIYILNNIIHAHFLPHIRYSLDHIEEGNMKIVMEYPILSNDVDISVVTPVYGFKFIGLPYGDPIWNIMMDNTHFSNVFLQKYMYNALKFCTIYPKIFTTMDGGTIPFTVPEEWTLMSGDYVDNSYAIFVKNVGNKLAMKMFVANHSLEAIPAEAKIKIMIDGDEINQSEDGVIIDELNKYTFKNDRLVVQSPQIPLEVEYSSSSVTLDLFITLRSRVTGICGHMDGTHVNKLPKIYTVTKI